VEDEEDGGLRDTPYNGKIDLRPAALA
jgi:hypothetical protein